MKATVKPSKAKGNFFAPPSKSITHRALICAGLAEGTSEIFNVSYSQDILATLDCLEMLGAKIQRRTDSVTVEGVSAFPLKSCIFPCRESASTLRFLIPILLLSDVSHKLLLSGSLTDRPLSVYSEICEKQGLTFNKDENIVSLKGVLSGGEYEIKGNLSSQFISGLLFALPLCEKDSTIKILPPVESKAYIDMTVETLSDFGVFVQWQDKETLYIKGNQSYKSANITVEGDWSNAAILEAFSVLSGDVSVLGLDPHSQQGDKVCKELFSTLKSGFCTVDVSSCPDLVPVLMVFAAYFHGARFVNTARLRIKESDRGTAMAHELSKFGATIEVQQNEIMVSPSLLKAPQTELSGHNDHRIVMSLCVIASVFGSTINGVQAVNKSYPDFFQAIKKSGIDVTISDD